MMLMTYTIAAAELQNCKEDLQCWGQKHIDKARAPCKAHIERAANYSAKWTVGEYDEIFELFKWVDKQTEVFGFIGDKVQFVNAFNAAKNFTYLCKFNTKTQQVVGVDFEPGLLPP